MNTHLMVLTTPVRVRLSDTTFFTASSVVFDIDLADESNVDYIKISACTLVDSKDQQNITSKPYNLPIRFYKSGIGSISELPPLPVPVESTQNMLKEGQIQGEDIKYVYNGGTTY